MFIQIYYIWKKLKHFWKQKWWYGKTLNKLDFFINKKFDEYQVIDNSEYNKIIEKEIKYNEKKYAEEEYHIKEEYLKLKSNILDMKVAKLDILNNERENEIVSNIKLKLSWEEIETTNDYPKVLYTSVGIISIEDKDFQKIKLRSKIEEENPQISSFNKMIKFLKEKNINYKILVRDITLDYDSPIFKTNIKIDEIKYESLLKNYCDFLTQLWTSKKKIIHVDDFIKVFTDNNIPIYKTFITKGIAGFDNFQVTLRNNIPVDIKELNFIKSKFKDLFDISVFNPSQLRLSNIRWQTDRIIEYKVNNSIIFLPWKVSMKYPFFCKEIDNDKKIWKNITKNVNYWYLKKILIENNFSTENSIGYGFLNSNLFFKEVIGYYYNNSIVNYKAFELLMLLYKTNSWKIKSLFFQGKELNELENDYFNKIPTLIKDKKEKLFYKNSIDKIAKNTKKDYIKIESFVDRFFYTKDVNKIFYAFYTAEQENRKDFNDLTLKEKNNFRNIYNYQTNLKDNFKTFWLKKNNTNGVNYVNAILTKNKNIQKYKNIFLYDLYFTLLKGTQKLDLILDKKKEKTKIIQEKIMQLQDNLSMDEDFFKLWYSTLNNYFLSFLKTWDKKRIFHLFIQLSPLLLNKGIIKDKDLSLFEKAIKNNKFYEYKIIWELNNNFFLNQIENIFNKKIWKEGLIEQFKLLNEEKVISSSKWFFYKNKEKLKINILNKIKDNFNTNYRKWNRFNTIRYTIYYIKYITDKFWFSPYEILYEFENMFYEELKTYNKEHWNYKDLINKIL